MAEVSDFVSCTITLQTGATPAVSYQQMLLVDSTDVPIDRRFRDTTRSGYTTDLTSTENTYKFAQSFWSQKRTADELRLGRWVSSASSPHFICGDHETDYTIWKLVSDGSFKVQDNTGTPLVDTITACDFTSITDLNGILTVLNTKLAALPPNIVGLDTATFAFDIEDRLVLTNSTTGAAAKTITIISDTTGTDLSVAAYFDAGTDGSDGLTIAGLDAEEPTAAISAIRAKPSGDDFYDCAIRGESAVQAQALAAQFEALDKQLTLVITDSDAKDSASTTDVPYLLSQLDYKNTMCIYTEHTITATGGWVDAAVQGAVLPAEEGSTAWSTEALSGVFESGKDIDNSPMALTTSERSALEGKNCNYVVNAGGSNYLRKGLVCSGDEKRVILGRHWMQNSIQADVHQHMLNVPLPAFDNDTLTAVEGVVRRYLTEALARKIIVDTRARPITVEFPGEDDFSASERASHEMTLSNVFSAYLNSSVTDVAITGELRI